ncbi:MAG: hypothetical protein ACKVKO_12385 [Acidimicrobiales bacterium]
MVDSGNIVHLFADHGHHRLSPTELSDPGASETAFLRNRYEAQL